METLDPIQLAEEAQAEYDKGKYLSAAKLFKAAADGFHTIKNELLAAEMANNCSVASLKGGEAEAALEVVRGTEEIFVTQGERLRQAMAIGNRAAALEALKRLDEAEAAYEQCAEILNELGEYELRAYVQQSISSIKLRKGQYLEAYAVMREGVMKIDKPNVSQRLLKTLIQLPFKFLK